MEALVEVMGWMLRAAALVLCTSYGYFSRVLCCILDAELCINGLDFVSKRSSGMELQLFLQVSVNLSQSFLSNRQISCNKPGEKLNVSLAGFV